MISQIFFAVSISVLALSPAKAVTCDKEPDLSKLCLEADELHESFYQLPSMNHNMVNTTPSEFVAIQKAYMHGPKHCPTWNETLSFHEGRLCPVYYVLNHDENRIPRSFVEARCSCSATPNDATYDCSPLKKYIKVQRRIGCDDDGVYIYSPMWETTQIGCYSQLSVRVAAAESPKSHQ